jgi:hypothetical protein
VSAVMNLRAPKRNAGNLQSCVTTGGLSSRAQLSSTEFVRGKCTMPEGSSANARHHIYIYIYIYMCVCVCVYLYFGGLRL